MQEKYGALLPDVFVFALIKFRCTNHRLWMEGGRQQNLPREDKKSEICNLSLEMNFIFFFFLCPAYTDFRTKFVPITFLQSPSAYNGRFMSSTRKKTLLAL